eukprot:COSAG01_NODE_4039_length_5406_cov_1.715980_1_plen_141_part_10
MIIPILVMINPIIGVGRCVCACGLESPAISSPGAAAPQPAVTTLLVPPPPQGSWLHELERWEEVDRPFPSWKRSILTEIYLCHACSCQEILRTETAGQEVDRLTRLSMTPASGQRREGAPPQSAAAAAAEPSPREAPPAMR